MVSRDHVVFLILPLRAPKPIKLKETSIPANSPNTSPPRRQRWQWNGRYSVQRDKSNKRLRHVQAVQRAGRGDSTSAFLIRNNNR